MNKIIIKNNIIDYLKYKQKGYSTAWVGNGLICLKKNK